MMGRAPMPAADEGFKTPDEREAFEHSIQRKGIRRFIISAVVLVGFTMAVIAGLEIWSGADAY